MGKRNWWHVVALFALCLGVVLGYWRVDRSSRGGRNRWNQDVRLGSGRMFDVIAPTYDVLNRIISLGFDQSWRFAAAMEACVRSGVEEVAPSWTQRSVLDVAAGTGDLSIILSECGTFSRIVALDPSEEMLSVLRSKPRAHNIEVVTGIVESLPFQDLTFDAVSVAFGVRNFQNRAKGLQELRRVLKSHGRLVILEVSVPLQHNGVISNIAKVFVGHVMPAMAGFLAGDGTAYRYLSDSMHKFPDVEEFCHQLESAGFKVLSKRRLWPFELGPVLYVAQKREAFSEPQY